MVTYRIAATDGRAHRYHVTLVLERPAAAQRLSLPVWIPGSYLVREFARHLSGLKARQGAREVALRQVDKATWEAATEGAEDLVRRQPDATKVGSVGDGGGVGGDQGGQPDQVEGLLVEPGALPGPDLHLGQGLQGRGLAAGQRPQALLGRRRSLAAQFPRPPRAVPGYSRAIMATASFSRSMNGSPETSTIALTIRPAANANGLVPG